MDRYIEEIRDRVLGGGEVTEEEAYALAEHPDKEGLYEAASQITRHFGKPEFQPCSIINARSGNCSEDCKWCAQSCHFRTAAQKYPVVKEEETLQLALHNERAGVKRFSQVASGKAVKGKDLEQICANFRVLRERTNLGLCASLGLVDGEAIEKLREAGATRYHCNLETAPSYFPSLCSTHTIEDKLNTIRAAHEAGLEVCSGGIIGMGETRQQRVEFALTLRKAKPVSIPINLLNPIKGTPLENAKPLSDEEILTTVAIFRFVHPKVELRFAGGRAQMSRDLQLRAMRIGINSAIMGDMLTTVGSDMEDDRRLIAEAGYKVVMSCEL